MEPQLRAWFSQGKIADALCGQGEYLIRDPTYGQHDSGFVLWQLCEWVKEDFEKETVRRIESARAFESALERLFALGALGSGLRLMRAYQWEVEENSSELPLDTERVISVLARELQKAGSELARIEQLRALACLVIERIPALKIKLGLK